MLINPHILAPAVANGFIFTVDTTKAGSASDTFVLKFGSIGTYNLTVYWGDGNSDVITAYDDGALSHTYSSSGSYQITLDGVWGSFFFNNGGDKLKMSSIDQWGSNVWERMSGAFYGCTNMTGTYSDTPDTSASILFNNTFRNCSVFNSPVLFDTSSGTSFASMFEDCFAFNQTINFDGTSATLLQYMFAYCTVFNSTVTISGMASVTDMVFMFRNAVAFNSTLTLANTSNVALMQYMFFSATVFNQDISGFDITALTTANGMLQNSAFSTTNYDLLLVAWEGQTELTGVTFHAGTAQYSAGAPATARGVLVGTSTWTITDGGAV